jgi:hypothetical protein
MNVTKRIVLTLMAIALVIGMAPLFAQAQDQAQQPPLTADGELMRVDADAMTFAIKAADDNELEFRYTEQTEVAGGASGIEGLATMGGTLVHVEYQTQDSVAVATKIEIEPQQ